MNHGIKTVLYPASDLEKTKVLFKALSGADPVADSPYYVGFDIAGQQIGLDPNGVGRGMTGATPFWDVDDIAGTMTALEAAGATVVEASHDVANGLLVAIMKDSDGSMIGLRQVP